MDSQYLLRDPSKVLSPGLLFYRDVKSERVRVTKPVKTCLRQFHGLDVDAIMTERNETPALIPLAGKRTVQREVSLTPISDFTGTAFVIEQSPSTATPRSGRSWK